MAPTASSTISGPGRPPSALRRLATAACALGCILPGFLALAPAGLADEITLKNGRVIEGSVEITGNRVTIRPWNSGAAIVLERDRIESIVPGDPPAPVDEPTADSGESPAVEPGEAPTEPPADPDPRPAPDARPKPAADLPRIEYFYTAPLDAQVRSALESVFPRMVRFCVEELGMTFNHYVPLNIEVIGSTQEFEAIEHVSSSLHATIRGFYAIREDKIVVRGDRYRQDIVSTLYHEASHALLRRELRNPPLWLDEGLAEFFKGFRVHGSATHIIDTDYYDGWSKYMLAHGVMIPLEEYLHLTNEQWRTRETAGPIQYVPRNMAWSLVTFLVSHEAGRHALERYIRALKTSRPSVARAAAYRELDSAYPGGVRELEAYWHSWIKRPLVPLKY